MNDKLNELANKARQKISKYCIEKNCTFCCHKGYIRVKQDKYDLIAGNKKEELEKAGIAKELWSGKILLDFSKSKTGCPSLKNGKCSIHKNPDRPNVCKNFPIFITSQEIKIANKCPAVKEGYLNEFKKEIEELGYKID